LSYCKIAGKRSRIPEEAEEAEEKQEKALEPAGKKAKVAGRRRRAWEEESEDEETSRTRGRIFEMDSEMEVD
jgi:hypothetical protein